MRTNLLIIGAGPYGLATAAYASERGVDALRVGQPVAFCHEHMPAGMLLRSPLDWQIDPFGRRTLLAFLLERGVAPGDADPVPLELFCDYAGWFQESYGLRFRPHWITDLTKAREGFEALSADGERILARHVLLAPGFAPFAHVPTELAGLVPAGRYSHTCDTVDFSRFRGRRCLIVGGRQSAYEWAALMAEAGAPEVHISHRHEQPRFEPSDWSWVGALIEATARERGWFRRLPETERESIRQHFWSEGRRKLEPWLAPRLRNDAIQCRPRTTPAACEETASGALKVTLDSGDSLTVDHILFATGYRVDVASLPLLSHAGIASALRTDEGMPRLDEDFQTNLDGLFMAGLPATRAFGPFFGFVAGAPAAARLIVERVIASSAG